MSGHTELELPWASVDDVLPCDDEGHARSFVRPVKSNGYQIAQTVGPNGSVKAAFIVTACNSHADLVRALEKIRDNTHGIPDWKALEMSRDLAREALATLTARKVG